jgi:hypothetical protein
MGQNNPATKVTEMSIVAISVFAAICLAVVATLITQTDFEIGLNAHSIAIGILLFAIVCFIFANDFFLLMIFHPEKQFFATSGSTLYSFGEAFMVVGITLALKAMTSCLISYAFLGVFTCGFLVYNGIRIWQVGLESPKVTRIILRVLNLLILVAGFVMICKIS